jgi:hypothetical protein
MAYVVNIPQPLKEQIKDIFKEYPKPKGRHMRFLATVYYRYTRINVDVDEEVDIAMGCGYCQAKIANYFKRQDWLTHE